MGLESMIQHPYSNNYTLTRASFGEKKKKAFRVVRNTLFSCIKSAER